MTFTKADEESLTSPDSQTWLLAHQGYDVSDTLFDLTITAHQVVRILQMSAFVIRCSHVATGTLLDEPQESPVITATGISFNLGSPDPVALNAKGTGQFFYGRTFEVAPGHPETFQVLASSNGASFEWEIDLTLLIGNNNESFLIGDPSLPFLTTGVLPKGGHYEAVFQDCAFVTSKLCSGLPSGAWVPAKH
jgi:hypothetical protein